MGEHVCPVAGAELGPRARYLLGGVYLLLFTGALAALASLSLGWRPDFVELWDGRARLVAKLSVLLLAGGALAGGIPLGATLPVPRVVRPMLGWAAAMAGVLMIMAALELSPDSALPDVVSEFYRMAAIGAALGLVVGLLGGLVSLLGQPDALPTQSARHHLGVLALLLVLAGMAAFDLGRERPRDDGKSTAALRLTTANGWVEVGSYEAPLLGSKTGYLRACADERMNSVVLLPEEWPGLVTLLSKVRSPSSSARRVVGSINDGASNDPTDLTVSDGPNVQLVLSSPKGPTIVAVLNQAEAVRLRAAIDSLTDKLD